MRSGWRGSLSLGTWVLLAGSGGTAAVLLAVVVALQGAGARPAQVAAAGLALVISSTVLVIGCYLLMTTVGRSLVGLRRAAVGLSLPTDPDQRPGRRVALVRELGDLVRTVDALHLRVRVSDDVAERYRLTAAQASSGMSRLVDAVVTSEEGARGQLAAELHDTVAQSLLLARHAMAADQADLVRVGDLVAEAEEQLRGVMARTRPPQLREGDLAQAVGLLIDDLEFRYGLSVEVAWPAVAVPLPLSLAVTVYRFLQEALLNVVKHTEVDVAELHVELSAGELSVWVGDRGPGLPADEGAGLGGRRAGLGLLRERAHAVGGRVEVGRREGGGTVVHLTAPVPVAAPRPGDGRGDRMGPEGTSQAWEGHHTGR
jgi:signal transduction histidine kinase